MCACYSPIVVKNKIRFRLVFLRQIWLAVAIEWSHRRNGKVQFSHPVLHIFGPFFVSRDAPHCAANCHKILNAPRQRWMRHDNDQARTKNRCECFRFYWQPLSPDPTQNCDLIEFGIFMKDSEESWCVLTFRTLPWRTSKIQLSIKPHFQGAFGRTSLV